MSVICEGADVVLLVNAGTDAAPDWREVAAQTDMTIELTAAMADATTKSDTHERMVPAKRGGSLELSALVIPSDAAQQILEECTCTRQTVKVRIAQNGVDAYEADGIVRQLRRRAEDGSPWLVDVTVQLTTDLTAL